MKAEPAHNTTTEPDPAPCPVCNEPGDPTWCIYDGNRVTAAIAGLPGQCQELIPGLLNTGRDIDTGPHRPGVDPPSPSPGWDTADEVIRWAIRTEDTLRTHLGHSDRRSEPYRTLATSVAYLGAQGAPLLESPDAEVVGLHALALATRLEQVTGSDQPTTRLSEPCLHCRHRGLEHVDGGESVHCRQCGGVWPWSHYVATRDYDGAAS